MSTDRTPIDWVSQLQAGDLPSDIDPLVELRALAADLDPADSIAIFANVDVPEIDLPTRDEPSGLPHHGRRDIDSPPEPGLVQ